MGVGLNFESVPKKFNGPDQKVRAKTKNLNLKG